MKAQEINKLGKELELYTFVDFIGKGFPIILPRGAKLISLFRNYVEQQEENAGYKVVRTPSISNIEIYKKEDQYQLENSEMFMVNNDNSNDMPLMLKPYSKPFHCTIFNEKQRTYKELPIKFCETSTVFRNEKDLKGLTKTRQFTLSDASVFCDREFLSKSVEESINIQKEFVDKLNLEVSYEIATWDDTKKEDYIGTIDEWESTVNTFKNVLTKLNIKYNITKNARIYGPLIRTKYNDKDFSSMQVDFEITHRFDTTFVNKENTQEFPIYIHNTIVGSYENLLGVLLEKYNGKFPISFAPVQICLIPEKDNLLNYCKEICSELKQSNLRVDIDFSNKHTEQKIEYNIKINVPIITIVGQDEVKNNELKVLTNDYIKEGNYKIKDFIKEVKNCQTQF